MNEAVRNLRMAVIGVGALGRHHARLLAGLPGVELVAVADSNLQRAQEIAAQYGTRALASADELPRDLDGVVVAVPTEAHVEIGLPFVERGVAVLVEKPLARTLAEADRLIEAAETSGALLGVGHTERFNPAAAAVLPRIKRPGFVEVHRLGTFPERSLDIDVVFDLMIHDLDLLLTVVGEDVVSVEAVGVPVLTPRIDIANVRLKFASGCIANLTASRISRDRIRKARFFQPQAYISIDFASQETELFQLVARPGQRPAIEGGKVEIEHDEPLRRELVDFCGAIREGRPTQVPAAHGRRALALAERIIATMGRVGA